LIRRGSGPKPSRIQDRITVTYSDSRWRILGNLRSKALAVLDGLGPWRTSALIHGSLARGDVDIKSDIDILIPASVSTQLVETSLEISGFQLASREIAQATPMHSPKAHLYLDLERKTAVTIPMTPFRRLEEEFYRFGGTVAWNGLKEEVRTKGCTKKLTLIEPTETGHSESPVVGRESEVARILGISTDIVRERVRVLSRRDSIGRTGIFLKLPVPEEVSFEEVLDQQVRANPALRRTLRMRASHGSKG